MRNNNLSFAISCILCSITACIPANPCKNSEQRCLHNATCDGETGSCICSAGYEGDSCQQLSRTKFLRNNAATIYQTYEESAFEPAIYFLHFWPDSLSHDSLLIGNVWNAFVNPVKAGVNENTLTIPRQEPDGDRYFVEGNGIFRNDTIFISYKVTDENYKNVLTENVTGYWFIKK